MRKMKRFFAVLLSAALLCPMTAYADNSEDAKALYHQVSETQKSITDMNAFADFKISIGGSILEDTGVDAMNLRMEMNMKMNHMTEPQQMRYMMYSRTTMDGMEEPMIISAYYQDGCYYQDSMGQKVKMPMDIGTMMEQSMASAMAFEDEFENYLSNFRLWDEGENKVIGFVAEADQMNEYFQMVMSSTGMSGLLDTAGITMDDVIYEEFKGTGNMELVLDRKLSEKRIFPAIDILKSGTRRDDLLLSRDEAEAVDIVRKATNSLKPEDSVERILDLFAQTRTNREFVEVAKKRRMF